MSTELLSWVQSGGLLAVVAILLAIIRWGISRKWVFGWQFEAVVKERDELKAIVYDLAGVVHRQAQTGYELVEKVKGTS